MHWQALAALVLLLPAVAQAGKLAQLLKLPLISGYVTAGVLAGPFVVGLLSQEAVNSLHFVDKCCLSVIALAAGAELHEGDLSRIRGQVTLQNLCWLCKSGPDGPLNPGCVMVTWVCALIR